MADADARLGERVRASMPRPDREPTFEETWQAARRRHADSLRNYRLFAACAAILAVAVIVLRAVGPTGQPYIEMTDLMESTYWSAPSDVLLPQPQFDIYQDMPEMFESTDPARGALL